jgi:FkbM family methyltransferase
MNPLLRLWNQPDFRSNPARAVWRRASWRVRWRITDRLWQQPFGPGLRIALPRRGTGVQIHYNGVSEPETANFIRRFVQPRMTVWDVGAHIGEYTLLAAHGAGPEGHVHAFEVNPDVLRVLETNVALNGFATVVCRAEAVSDRTGEADFVVRRDSARASLPATNPRARQARGDATIRVATVTLDNYGARFGRPDLVKVDVQGAELLVFRGASVLLGQRADAAPVVIFEYAPGNAQALGFDGDDALKYLLDRGYRFYRLDQSGGTQDFDPSATLPPALNLVASKRSL